MPRDGSLILSDICEPTLKMICERCGRHGRYSVARLIAAHGADAKLPNLLVTLANCEKARSFSVYDRCKARFEGFSVRASEGRALTLAGGGRDALGSPLRGPSSAHQPPPPGPT